MNKLKYTQGVTSINSTRVEGLNETMYKSGGIHVPVSTRAGEHGRFLAFLRERRTLSRVVRVDTPLILT